MVQKACIWYSSMVKLIQFSGRVIIHNFDWKYNKCPASYLKAHIKLKNMTPSRDPTLIWNKWPSELQIGWQGSEVKGDNAITRRQGKYSGYICGNSYTLGVLRSECNPLRAGSFSARMHFNRTGSAVDVAPSN